MNNLVEWVGIKPEERRLKGDYCTHCGISRGVDVLNYRGPCEHEWETVVFVPEARSAAAETGDERESHEA